MWVWTSSTACNLDDDDTFVYIGGRLECEDEDFLTSRLFLRIQMLFNNAFQCEDDNKEGDSRHLLSSKIKLCDQCVGLGSK